MGVEGMKPGGMTPARRAVYDSLPKGGVLRYLYEVGMGAYADGEPGGAKPGKVETASLRATLPGKHGLECIFYEYVAARTVHLRKEVYVAWRVEGGEFRPADVAGHRLEHSPRIELQKYQMARGLFGGEHAYGMGRPTRVTFVCYSPRGSGAAAKAVEAISGALEKLEGVAKWPDGKRSWFGMRHGRAWGSTAQTGGPAYRPPADALPARLGPPKPPESDPPSGPSFGEALDERVDAMLRSWGHADVADERRRERREKDRRTPEEVDAEWREGMRRELAELRGMQSLHRPEPRGAGARRRDRKRREDLWTS